MKVKNLFIEKYLILHKKITHSILKHSKNSQYVKLETIKNPLRYNAVNV